MKIKSVSINTDGASRGNPGPAAIGVTIKDDRGKLITSISQYIGVTTNNQAEYRAVILALEKAKDLEVEEIDFYLDSELVVSQLKGDYKVKNKELASLFVKIWNLAQQFKKVRYFHVPREENKEADRLANQAMDEGSAASW